MNTKLLPRFIIRILVRTKLVNTFAKVSLLYLMMLSKSAAKLLILDALKWSLVKSLGPVLGDLSHKMLPVF